MISDSFPDAERSLSEQIRLGVRTSLMDKPQMFSPDLIDEINFCPGRHLVSPVGHVQSPATGEVKLLHYKYLGVDYYCERLGELRQGLRKLDLERGLGFHYLRSRPEKAAQFQKLRKEACEVI